MCVDLEYVWIYKYVWKKKRCSQYMQLLKAPFQLCEILFVNTLISLLSYRSG